MGTPLWIATSSLVSAAAVVSFLVWRLRSAGSDRLAEEKLRAADLQSKLDAANARFTSATAEAAAARADAAHYELRVDALEATVGGLRVELDAAQTRLVEAVAGRLADENAARSFEAISRKVLRETLDSAKGDIAELAAGLQKTGSEELRKHAEKVAASLEPLHAKLRTYDESVESLKRSTLETFGGIREQMLELQKAERSLHDQAKALTSALSAGPKVRGNYGEVILERLVEFAGMSERCHFDKQASRETDEGRKIPDMVIHLPGSQKVLVDSKAVMDAYLDASLATDDDLRSRHMDRHCKNVRSRVAELSSKNYFAEYRDAVEAVVLFLPAENLYAAAMENDPGLIEYAVNKNIIIAGPNNLLMLLLVASKLWRRAAVEEEAQEVARRGAEVYKTACDFLAKFARIGTRIQQLESDYNDAAGTLDARLIPAGRALGAMNSISIVTPVPETPSVREDVRGLRSSEARLKLAPPPVEALLPFEDD